MKKLILFFMFANLMFSPASEAAMSKYVVHGTVRSFSRTQVTLKSGFQLVTVPRNSVKNSNLVVGQAVKAAIYPEGSKNPIQQVAFKNYFEKK
jgi:hypothetical protein